VSVRDQIASANRVASAAPSVERVERIEARLAAIQQELTRNASGHLPKAEVTARLMDWLRTRREHGEPFRRDIKTAAGLAESVVSSLSAEPPRRPELRDHEHVFSMLLFLLWPAIEQSAPAAIARLDYTPGRSSRERAAMKASLTKERAALVAEHEQLVDQVNEISGGSISLQHLDETRQRRQEAERDRASEEAQRRRQQELSDQIERSRKR
jgi:hypothetical protein